MWLGIALCQRCWLPAWLPRQLGSAAEMGSQAIQKIKDTAPYVAAAGVGLLAVAGPRKKPVGADNSVTAADLVPLAGAGAAVRLGI